MQSRSGMNLSGFILLFIVGQCAAGRPCARLAEIIGDVIDWMRWDYDIGQITDWQMDRYIDEARDEMMNSTGIDITSASDREEAICEVFRFKRLRQLYDFLEDYRYRPSYEYFCRDYIRGLGFYEQEPQLNVDFIKLMYSIAKDLAQWMQNSGFPERFPPSTSHDDNVGALQAIENELDADDHSTTFAIRGLLTDLLPIGPLISWETEGYHNRSTVEEVVGWMEDSNNIFTYAGFIKEQNRWFSVRDLKMNVGMLGLARNNYDKILWYEEALTIFLKSNVLKLDTSDCPEDQYQYHYGGDNNIPQY